MPTLLHTVLAKKCVLLMKKHILFGQQYDGAYAPTWKLNRVRRKFGNYRINIYNLY
jgi:hypothetical protein